MKTNFSILLIVYLLSSACNSVDKQSINTAIQTDTIKKGEGLCIYLPKKPMLGIMKFFDIDTVTLADTPYIKYENIIGYDTIGHKIILNYRILPNTKGSALRTFANTPFVVTFNKKSIYGGWFTTGLSSEPASWIHIKFFDGFDSLDVNEVRIKPPIHYKHLSRDGYKYLGDADPDFLKNDVRNNHEIFDRLKADGKIINKNEDTGFFHNLKKVFGRFKKQAEHSKQIPEASIKQNFSFDVYPNPASDFVSFTFGLDKNTPVVLEIFSASGQKMYTLIDNKKYNEGVNTIKWNVPNDAKGIFKAKLSVGNNSKTTTIVLK